jgi:hypothetical protein
MAVSLLCQQLPQQWPVISKKPVTWLEEIMAFTDHFDPRDYSMSLVPCTKQEERSDTA